jgi:hypothetical protein
MGLVQRVPVGLRDPVGGSRLVRGCQPALLATVRLHLRPDRSVIRPSRQAVGARPQACPEQSSQRVGCPPRRALATTLGLILASTPASDDLKRCTKCGEEKPRAEFSRDRSRKDGRFSQCKACVRRWQQENAEHLADYHLRWQQENRDKKRAQDRRYRERKRDDPPTGSENEPTPAAAIGSGERRTPIIGSDGELTTAAIGSESEPESPTNLPKQSERAPPVRHTRPSASPGAHWRRSDVRPLGPYSICVVTAAGSELGLGFNTPRGGGDAGPTDQFRRHVWGSAEDVDSEDALSELLDEIEEQIRADIAGSADQLAAGVPNDQLAAAESWASVASYPMARLSAPASPWGRKGRRVAGWGTPAIGRLRSTANTLSAALQPIAPAVGATSFSIGVSFPWGIQISLSW